MSLINDLPKIGMKDGKCLISQKSFLNVLIEHWHLVCHQQRHVQLITQHSVPCRYKRNLCCFVVINVGLRWWEGL